MSRTMPRVPRLKGKGGRYAERGTPAEQLLAVMDFVGMSDADKLAMLDKMKAEKEAKAEPQTDGRNR